LGDEILMKISPAYMNGGISAAGIPVFISRKAFCSKAMTNRSETLVVEKSFFT